MRSAESFGSPLGVFSEDLTRSSSPSEVAMAFVALVVLMGLELMLFDTFLSLTIVNANLFCHSFFHSFRGIHDTSDPGGGTGCAAREVP